MEDNDDNLNVLHPRKGTYELHGSNTSTNTNFVFLTYSRANNI
jgi:hypothetical protein